MNKKNNKYYKEIEKSNTYEEYKEYMFISHCKYKEVDFKYQYINEFTEEKPFYGYFIKTFYSDPYQLILMKDYFTGEYLYFFQDGFLAEKLETISQTQVEPKLLRIYSSGELDKYNSPRLIDVIVEIRI